MKIAFVSYCGHPWGGSEDLWCHTAREALLQGHEVLVSVFDWPTLHPRIQELKDLGARMVLRRRYYPVPGRRLQKKIYNIFLPQGRKATYHDYLRAFRPNHILFSLAGGTEIADDPTDLMVFIRQTRIPFSVMYHSMNPAYVYPPDRAANMREVVSRSRHSIFISQFQTDVYRRQLAHPIDNAVVVRHNIQIIQPTPVPDASSGPVRMCIIASLVKRWKGQDIAIDVLSLPVWKARDWVLDLYGTGEDKDDLVAQVARAGLADRVLFHGFVNNIPEVLASHHLVLLPSRQEGGPILLYEAMHAGRPIVGTPMGAMPENVTDGVNGFLAKTIDSQGYADALERAWQVRARWPEIGKAAHAHIMEQDDPSPQRTVLRMISG